MNGTYYRRLRRVASVMQSPPAILILKRGTHHTIPLVAFSWERRRLACSGSGQDGRAPRGLSDGHDLRRRLFPHQIAKMRTAAQRGIMVDTLSGLCSTQAHTPGGKLQRLSRCPCAPALRARAGGSRSPPPDSGHTCNGGSGGTGRWGRDCAAPWRHRHIRPREWSWAPGAMPHCPRGGAVGALVLDAPHAGRASARCRSGEPGGDGRGGGLPA